MSDNLSVPNGNSRTLVASPRHPRQPHINLRTAINAILFYQANTISLGKQIFIGPLSEESSESFRENLVEWNNIYSRA